MSIRLLADENFSGDILRGLLRVEPKLDIIRAQDTELYEQDDPTVLAWAAKENRILLTHDVRTMTKYAYDRIKAGLSTPAVIEVSDEMPIGQAINEILVVLGASDPAELVDRVIFVPLQG